MSRCCVPERILIIKLSALGDFMQALGPMKAIRDYHKDAEITLLTTPPFVALARQTGWFKTIWDNGRAKGLSGLLALRTQIGGAQFDFVYDLQTSGRTNWLYQLLRPSPPRWSGVAWGCSHPHANPRRVAMHTVDRQAEQLLMAGIPTTPLSDLSFIAADVSRFALTVPYALLVPGGAAHRPEKRWPLDAYKALAVQLATAGMTPVVLGGKDERALGEAIRAVCSRAINLAGETSIIELAVLGRGAALCVGNDTGPMHVLAYAGAPALALFGPASDPARCGQRGRKVQIIAVADLAKLSAGTVATESLKLAEM
ncbi:MAG: glycosyltransferase family 9 protein [Alphaproteobacteria bacterium]|nr:glycosyltransferase family 9 protein [Alphaproteobacteria bacterium]